MNKNLFLILGLIMPCCAGTVQTFTNPLDVKIADPHILRHEGTYYLYATAADPREVDEGIPVWSSRDLVNWKSEGLAFQPTEQSWATMWFWGPDVHYHNGQFLMFYGGFKQIDGRPVGRICLAASDSPTGPFRDLKAPLFDWPVGDAIDASLFIDNDQTPYLYFTSTHAGNLIYGVELKPNLQELAGESVLLLSPEQDWEITPVNEGAYVFRREDTYFMLYAGNDFRQVEYSVGLAMADSPLGPWTKYSGNPLVSQTPLIKGPGCAGLISSPDQSETLIYYHVHLTPDGYMRQLALDRFKIGRFPDGSLLPQVIVPSHTPQPYPSGAPTFKSAGNDEFDGAELDLARWVIVDERPEQWLLHNQQLEITTRDGDMWQHRADYKNLFLQYVPEGDWSVSTQLEFQPQANYEQAFLCVWQDADHFLRLSLAYDEQPVLAAAVEIDRVYRSVSIPYSGGAKVFLRITKTADTYTLAWSSDEENWQPVGAPCELSLQNIRVGLGAIAPGSMEARPARFDHFRIETLGSSNMILE